ncbi:hypothetical protein KR093_010475 [Drosophila rubida]|uniref:Dendritic cell-specific transmembrane protein-like domain-containing protein n=1 Tax=Drosophila rubida TaxID=30044 RepID=A0AAD4K2S4_9MUSC|nr:hypothetical protein KR093_010475 [Drosophila rubida]
MLVFTVRVVRNFVAALSKPLYCLLYGNEQDERMWIIVLRYASSFVIGVLLSYFLGLLMSLNYHLNFLFRNFVRLPIVTLILVLNGISFMLSRNVRAVTLLIFVSIADKAGHKYLRALAFGLLISGPVANLVRNAGEVSRVFACSTMLTYNLTKTRFDLIAKPFTNTLQHMRGDIDEIQANFKELQTILHDLKLGMQHSDDEADKFSYYKYLRAAANSTTDEPARRLETDAVLPKAGDVQEQFVRRLGSRCKRQLESGHEVCEEVFSQGFRKCATNFPSWLANTICWPYRIDVICRVNMFGNPDKVCDAAQVVPPDFGQNYVKLLLTEQQLYGNSSNIRINYKVQNSSTAAQLRSAQKTSQEFVKDFEHKRRLFDFVVQGIDKLMLLFIFYVIWSAAHYNWRYRCSIEHDNYYITDYFKHVDARRKNSSESYVLPLRSLEKSRLVDLHIIGSRTAAESRLEGHFTVHFLLEIFPTLLFLLLDHMVVKMLRIISNRSLVSYQQEGEHEVRFRINGTGLMARLLRTTMRNFNIHERVSTSLSNKECLPVASTLPLSFYLKLLALYVIIMLLMFRSSTVLRLRRIICSYFYYKREKRRILFLYGSVLRNRATYLQDVRQNAEENLATRHTQGQLNVFLLLRLGLPKQFGWLRSFQCAKRRCLICSRMEDSRFIVCRNCDYPYCRECCRDMSYICIFCEQILPRNKGVDSTIDNDAPENTSKT